MHEKLGWEKVKIGALVNSVSENNTDKDKPVILINTSDVLDGKVLNHERVKNENLKGQFKKSFRVNDILFSEIRPKNGRNALINFIPENYIASTKLMVLRPKHNNLNVQYLYYLLTSKNSLEYLQSIAESRSGTFPQITFSTLSEIEIGLPKLDEQKRIANLLSSFDDKIENNNAIIANLEEQAQTIFKSWFVDNPKDTCTKGALTDLGEIVAGGTPSKKKAEYYTDGDIPWITPKDLSNMNRKFVSKGSTDITSLGLEKSSAKLMPRGTVLFSSRAPIGYIAIAKNEVSTNQGFKSVVPYEDIGTPYVYYFLKNNVSVIENMASGSTFKEISGSGMKKVPALVPDREILEKFNSFCEPLFLYQASLEYQNEKLTEIRDTLLPKLMAGEIRVEGAENITD